MELPMRDARRPTPRNPHPATAISWGPRGRAVIEHVAPEIDAGRFPIKRVPGERVVVEADIFAEGHDELACVLLHRPAGQSAWTEVAMRPLVNDRWRGEFRVGPPGRHVYTLEAWVDHFHTWVRDLVRRLEAGQDVTIDLQIGAALVEAAAARAGGDDAGALRDAARAMTASGGERTAMSPQLAELMASHPDRCYAPPYERALRGTIDRARARFTARDELFR